MKHRPEQILCMLWIVLAGFSACREEDRVRFGVVYGKIAPEQVAAYDLVILEPDHYSKREIDAIKATGSRVIAYISLGEVDPNRWYFPYLEERGFLGVNENWGSYFIRLDDEETRQLLLDKVLPNIMIKGFDGLFLDTVDAVAPYAEDRKHLQPYMAALIEAMDRQYPDAYIIQNAGLFLLDRTAPHIDVLLIEDIASMYDFKTQTYALKPEAEFKERAAMMQDLAQQYGKPVWIIDFADTPALKQQMEERLRPLPFDYFISTIDLSELPAVDTR